MTILIAGGYDLLSEPARSAAEYAQWRQAKTMTLGEKSCIVFIPPEGYLSSLTSPRKGGDKCLNTDYVLARITRT